MTRCNLAGVLAAVLATATLVAGPSTRLSAQDPPSLLPGRWNLNRDLSEFPREIGFAVDWVASDGTGLGSNSGGRGGRGSRGGGGGSARPFIVRRESEDDVKRVQQLTAEVRTPPGHLTITETDTTITIADDRGQSRTFHPEVRDEAIRLEGVSVGVTAKRESGRLVVVYNVEQGRQLRYTYYQVPRSSQLTVDVQFVERGGGDSVRRVYDPAGKDEVWPPAMNLATAEAAAAAAAAPPRPGAPPLAPANPDAGRAGNAPAAAPAPAPAEQPQNQKPGAELKGLATLGLVVEDLSPEATGCGLNQSTLETTLSKRLSDTGLKVLRNSDEDTYVYVNINTAKVSTGLCVSRYDVFLYTHTNAKLSYQQSPVLVQVSLLHTGGIGGGAPAAHAATVVRDLQEYVDQMAARIRDANR